jgi:acetylornithine deacetylase
MIKLINAFAELERPWGLTYYKPELDAGLTTLTVSMIRGGESFSSQADECSMTIASLFSPDLSVDEIRKQILATIQYIADHDHWLKDHRPEYELPFPPKVPLNVPNNDECIKTAISATDAVIGLQPQPRIMEGVGDANYMFEKGMKCVNWGPGEVGLAHSTNEYVEVQEFIDAAKAYASTAVHWCGIKT